LGRENVLLFDARVLYSEQNYPEQFLNLTETPH